MGTLSIVATPIGNLEDITLRAIRTLRECDAVYAEDTRVAAKLLARYEIAKPVFRLDAATEGKKAEEVLRRLEAGERVAYVSDAGTPGVSDPGARLVAYIRGYISRYISNEAPSLTIEAIPGPSALTAALSIAGLESSSFLFLGFLPHKKGRRTAIEGIARSEVPVVLYESPHRILKLLEELAASDVARVRVARELTKIHEEFLEGEPREVAADLEKRGAARGEFVLIADLAR